MTSSRSIVLFSMPRCGTTPVLELLHHHLESKTKTAYLGEYFQIHLDEPTVLKDGMIFINHEPNPSINRGTIGPDLAGYQKRIGDKRLALLKRTKFPYVMKLFPHQLTPDQIKDLNQRADFVVLDRKDHLQHCLSFCIARTTNVWYHRDRHQQKLEAITLDLSYVERFFMTKKLFYQLHKVVKNPIQTTYENFINRERRQFLQEIFHEAILDEVLVKPLVPKQNPDNKMELVKNAEDFLFEFNLQKLRYQFE